MKKRTYSIRFGVIAIVFAVVLGTSAHGAFATEASATGTEGDGAAVTNVVTENSAEPKTPEEEKGKTGEVETADKAESAEETSVPERNDESASSNDTTTPVASAAAVVTFARGVENSETADVEHAGGPGAQPQRSGNDEPSKNCKKKLEKEGIVVTDIRVNGTSTGEVSLEDVEIEAGDKVTVVFTVPKGCKNVRVSFAAYETESAVWNVNDKQTLIDSDSEEFASGKHELTVTVPECFYQLDFVLGAVIEAPGGEEGGDGWYNDAKITWVNGGSECPLPEDDEEVAEVEDVVETPVTEDVAEEVVKEDPAEEVAEEVAAQPEAPEVVAPTEVQGVAYEAPEVLAYTGINTKPTLFAGIALLLMGASAIVAARFLARRTA